MSSPTAWLPSSRRFRHSSFCPRLSFAASRVACLEYFPVNTVILSAGRGVADALYIVQKGAVKLALRTHVGKELALDTRAEGEFFGLLSLLGRDVARLDVTALVPSHTTRPCTMSSAGVNKRLQPLRK